MTLEPNTIYCGDCLDLMKEIPDGSIDAVVTDPPFGIGFKYGQYIDTVDGYGEWLWSCIEMAERKCKPGSPVFVWQAMPNVRRFAEWFPREWRLFAAAKNFVQMRPTAMQYSWDPVVVWWTEGERWYAGTASRDFDIADTSPSRRMEGKPDHVEGHPCPRPLFQVQHILSQWARPDGIVLDPFLGSGTTAVAALRTGRRFIGIEIDPEYCAIAQKRVDAELAQTRLEL